MDEFDSFQAYYDDAKERIDERIAEVLDDHEEFATKRKILAHATRGGKRIRPVLTLLVAEVYDAPYDRAINHAAIVELIHNAALVADDRYDEDATRRGAPALWRVLEKLPFGRKGHKVTTGLSIMAENGLVALAIELAEDPDVVQAIGRGLRHLVDGFFREGSDMTFGIVGGGYDRYIEVNKGKTGGLFSLAAWMPATYVDPPQAQEEAAREYGMETGVLYQVADDYADGDLPSYVTDPAVEMEEWCDRAVANVDDMPDHERADLLRIAPAWMVFKMFEQEDVELDVDFIPEGAL